jgi:LacI family transcriptional regulator
MKQGPDLKNTIDDVARRAGVSIKTVSRVLNREPNVRESTREKVLSTAKAMGYAPNISARRLAARRSFIVALVYHDDDVNHYIPDIQHGVLDSSRERGYNLLLHPCQGTMADAAHEIQQLARQSLIDGFILTPPLADSRKLLVQMTRQGVPFARVSQLYRGELSPSVSVGDRAGAYKMVEYLAGLKHRRIAFIVGNENQGASIDRLRGYREALAEIGIPEKPEWIRHGDFTFESGTRCMEELLALRNRPTAVFASNDDMAAGALLVAHRRGYTVPAEISIVGFDDISMAKCLWPPLTTVRQPIKKAAAIATAMLLDSLRTGDFSPVNQEIPGELVVRESAAAAPE